MALRGQKGNKPEYDGEGYVHGVVASVKDAKGETKIPRQEGESLLWTFETMGTHDLYTFRVFTTYVLNPPHEKTGHLNKVSAIVVGLGILTLEDLSLDPLPDHDFESAIGLLVKFKLDTNDKGFYEIDLSTLVLDEKA